MSRELGWSRRFHSELVDAGWTPERRIDTSEWRAGFESEGVHMFPVVEEFLARFGRLFFEEGKTESGGVRFQVEINPDLCLGDGQFFTECGEELGKDFFPLGEYDRGRYYLGMDSDGVIYRATDGLASFGREAKGLEALVLGTRPKPVT